MNPWFSHTLRYPPTDGSPRGGTVRAEDVQTAPGEAVMEHVWHEWPRRETMEA